MAKIILSYTNARHRPLSTGTLKDRSFRLVAAQDSKKFGINIRGISHIKTPSFTTRS